MRYCRTFKVLLAGVLCALLIAPAVAAGSEMDTASDYLRMKGIMVGDQNGDMRLSSSLTRSELATIICRLTVNQEHVAAEKDLYTRKCTYPDVPDWAKVYVGYCSFNGLMVGYGGNRFGGLDPVTPAAACTVVLRYLDYQDAEWDYNTACDAALELGLTTASVTEDAEITRGDLAVMLYRAMGGAEPDQDSDEPPGGAHALSKNADGSINVPSDGSQYVPQVGDVIRCDDGTNYTITDVSRYDNNMFASGPLGPLPEPTCDWSLLEQPELPEVEVRRYQNVAGDNLRIRNLYETRRMLYTLYNAIGDNPATWQNGGPVLTVKGNQRVHINLSIPDDQTYQMFWPWRASEIVNLFNSLPAGTFSMQAWDVYKDGVFLQTEYQIRTN